ncbi:MAG: hypothetical protein ACR2M7_06050 [Bdellovibrionales bacterium]
MRTRHEYTIKNELKSKLQRELISFVDVERVKNNAFIYFKGKNHEEVYEDFWNDLRDEWIDELNDRLITTLDVIGYANGLEIALGLGYWAGYDNNILGIEINNAETLGFVASYEYVIENGTVYDVVDALLLDYFEVELNN